MSAEGRWTVVVIVLAIAGVVALWPRDAGVISTAADPLGIPSDRVAVQQDDAELAPARAAADLANCPTSTGLAGRGPLAGLVAPCLGQPGLVQLGPALAGRPVLLNLWASWCGPCRDEMPVLQAYSTEPGAIDLLGVNVRDQPSDALALAAAVGVRYPSVTDPNNAIQAALNAPPALPSNWIVHPDGSAERITDPLVFHTPDQVRNALNRALRAP